MLFLCSILFFAYQSLKYQHLHYIYVTFFVSLIISFLNIKSDVLISYAVLKYPFLLNKFFT